MHQASGSFGCRAWNPATEEWLQLRWPASRRHQGQEMKEENIMTQELLLIVLACAVGGARVGHWWGTGGALGCGNTAAVVVLNAGLCQVPQIMPLLRSLPVFH